VLIKSFLQDIPLANHQAMLIQRASSVFVRSSSGHGFVRNRNTLPSLTAANRRAEIRLSGEKDADGFGRGFLHFA